MPKGKEQQRPNPFLLNQSNQFNQFNQYFKHHLKKLECLHPLLQKCTNSAHIVEKAPLDNSVLNVAKKLINTISL